MTTHCLGSSFWALSPYIQFLPVISTWLSQRLFKLLIYEPELITYPKSGSFLAFLPKCTSCLVTQVRNVRDSLSLKLPRPTSYSHQFASWISLESTTSFLLQCQIQIQPVPSLDQIGAKLLHAFLSISLAPLQPILHTESQDSCLFPKHTCDYITLSSTALITPHFPLLLE